MRIHNQAQRAKPPPDTLGGFALARFTAGVPMRLGVPLTGGRSALLRVTLPRSDTYCQNSFDFCGDAGPADERTGERSGSKPVRQHDSCRRYH